METGKITLNDQKDEEEIIAHVLKALKGIRYGYVQITVQDARVVQIEKAEKIRLNNHSLNRHI